MAKLYISRQPDGTYRLRAQRQAGKELVAHKTVGGIKKQELSKEAAKLMDEVAPPKSQPGPV